MANKSISHHISAPKVNMGGHIIDQPLPHQELDYFDPFLLIHHWKDTMPGGQRPQDVGVGIHPHRGFSPVTFIFKGSIHHRDSMGNSAIVDSGGTQWMFAGKGITHSERPSAKMAEEGGEVEFIQFWVNAPAANKMQAAFYKPISADETPTYTQEGLDLQIVCGEHEGMKGHIEYYSPLTLLRGTLQENSSYSFNLPSNHNSLIYLLDGSMEINGAKAKAKDMICFTRGEDSVVLNASKDCRFIVLSGEPLNEPVATYGPFVMNTETEIMQTLQDAQKGKLGVLIEDF
ncbi:pirin family protein [Bacteroidia bacterium]|nr:pirin family protein [Bacteroidia bacterium]